VGRAQENLILGNSMPFLGDALGYQVFLDRIMGELNDLGTAYIDYRN
jgi:hypothetical protein